MKLFEFACPRMTVSSLYPAPAILTAMKTLPTPKISNYPQLAKFCTRGGFAHKVSGMPAILVMYAALVSRNGWTGTFSDFMCKATRGYVLYEVVATRGGGTCRL